MTPALPGVKIEEFYEVTVVPIWPIIAAGIVLVVVAVILAVCVGRRGY